MSPTITIIVPIFNAEKTLVKCLDSISSQTYTDYELILVDDGSTDNSLIICENYKENNKRTKVIHQDNGGVSSARNLGLKYADSDWITFVDPDDFAHPNYLKDLFGGVDDKCEMVIQGFNYVNNKGKVIGHKLFKSIKYDMSSQWRLFNDFHLYRVGVPFAKLYKSSILEKADIKFDSNVSYGEDLLFMLKYMQNINYVTVLEKANYYYRYGNINSLSRIEHSSEKLFYLFRNTVIYCDINKMRWHYENDNGFICHNAIFLHRAFSALYKRQLRKCRKERISFLRNCHKNYYLYIEKLKLGAIQKRSICILYLLLYNRCFFIFDSIMYLTYRNR